MKKLLCLFGVLLLAACAHGHQKVVTVPQETDWQQLYIDTQSDLKAAEAAAAAVKAIRDEYMRELTIRQMEQEHAFREWQRNVGARMHRPQ